MGPALIHHRAAEKKGPKVMKEFAEKVFKQMGMRVLVLSAYKDADGQVLVSS
jgi:ketopantoate hydroxymethyltransferase